MKRTSKENDDQSDVGFSAFILWTVCSGACLDEFLLKPTCGPQLVTHQCRAFGGLLLPALPLHLPYGQILTVANAHHSEITFGYVSNHVCLGLHPLLGNLPESHQH